MKIKKFEGYKSGKYDYEFGGHVFVLARYKQGWNNFKYNTPFENEEFVPCMISGNLLTQYSKHDFRIIGETTSWNIDDFEIMEGSDKGFQEMIELYSKSKKYNL